MKYRYKGACPNTQAMLQSCFPGQTVFEGQQSGNKVRVRLPRVGTIDLKLDEVEEIEDKPTEQTCSIGPVEFDEGPDLGD